MNTKSTIHWSCMCDILLLYGHFKMAGLVTCGRIV